MIGTSVTDYIIGLIPVTLKGFLLCVKALFSGPVFMKNLVRKFLGVPFQELQRTVMYFISFTFCIS